MWAVVIGIWWVGIPGLAFGFSGLLLARDKGRRA